MNTNKKQNRLRVNHQIRIPQVRVIVEDGSTLGIMSTSDALRLAQEKNLDLVEINPMSNPPICKIIDYGKFKYDEKKKASANKQKIHELKELKLRPNTDDNDLNHKLKLAKDFLADKHQVKFTIRFRGREIVHTEVGKERIQFIIENLKSNYSHHTQPSLDGKMMTITFFPSK